MKNNLKTIAIEDFSSLRGVTQTEADNIKGAGKPKKKVKKAIAKKLICKKLKP